MTANVETLKAFLASAGKTALVEVAATKGSTPRETGAYMLVSAQGIHGTIGGGQLEYMAIDKARQLLRVLPSPLRGGSTGKAGRGGGPKESARIEVNEVCATLDVPLGPEIGQCCGGRVEVAICLVDQSLAQELVAAAEAQEEHLPHLYIFGGGHVGKALAAATALLPVHVFVVETRAEELEGVSDAVETRLTPMPEEMVRTAPSGSAFAILTHDHALDFLIVAEALKRDDTAYVGMIGSKTKKATFRSWFLKTAGGTEKEFARLVSPIGGDAVKDKRPPVIAALAAAEMMTALVRHHADQVAEPLSPVAAASR